MMKRALLIMLAVFVITGPAYARTDDLSCRCWRAAALHVPGSAMPESMEDRGNILAFHFIDENRQRSYEVLISRGGGTFLQRSMVANAVKAGERKALDAEDIKRLIVSKHPDASIDGIFLRQTENGLYSFLAVFTQQESGRLHRRFYNAQSGEMMADTMWPAGPEEGSLTFRQAADKALGPMLKTSVMTDIQVERSAEALIYQVSLNVSGEEQSFFIDAKNGRLLDKVVRGKEKKEPEALSNAAVPGEKGSSGLPEQAPPAALPAAGRPAVKPAAPPPHARRPDQEKRDHGRGQDDDHDDGDDDQDEN